MAIKPYLQLVRLPNLFTAAADPLAGWLLATGTPADPGRWVPLVVASVLVYAGGIVLNDVFDVEIDRRERPGRPLPSGRVPFRPAAWFGGLALASGPIVAALSGSTASAAVAGVLALCVLAYDGGMKRTWFGPVFMGACRSLNLLLGFSQVDSLGGTYAWVLAGSFGLFVLGVTVISRSEVEAGQRWGIALGVAVQVVAICGFRIGFANLAFDRYGIRPNSSRDGALLVWLVVFFVVIMAGYRAIRHFNPEFTQRAVKTGVLSLVWLDVAAVASIDRPPLALAVAALWVPAFLLGRWLYST